MTGKIVFFKPKRKGHHSDYINFLINYWKIRNHSVKESFFQKFISLFSDSKIILLDIDKNDLLYIPIIFILKIFKLNSKLDLYAISVRSSEIILPSRSIINFLLKKGKYLFFKNFLKKQIFLFLKKTDLIKIYSIHIDNINKKKLKAYFHDFFHDFQYYDLEYYNFKFKRPEEIDTKFLKKSILIFIGANQSRRNLDELLTDIIFHNSKDLKFTIVGKSKKSLNFNDKIVHINRYVENSELLFLIKNCLVVYCFYNNFAPSGFFGRSIQLNKKVIVSKGGYLDNFGYINSIPINKVSDIPKIDFFSIIEKKHNYNFVKPPKLENI